MFEDPSYTRWKHDHPKFPGVAKCVELLGRRNVQGSLLEIILGELQDNAATHAAELIAAFQAQKSARVRCLLLMTFCDAKLPEAMPLFVEHLRSEEERLRYWSEEGLRIKYAGSPQGVVGSRTPPSLTFRMQSFRIA
jgi:hypothetical protein